MENEQIIKPCPFCGGKAFASYESSFIACAISESYVECESCYAKGPTANGLNTRVCPGNCVNGIICQRFGDTMNAFTQPQGRATLESDPSGG